MGSIAAGILGLDNNGVGALLAEVGQGVRKVYLRLSGQVCRGGYKVAEGGRPPGEPANGLDGQRRRRGVLYGDGALGAGAAGTDGEGVLAQRGADFLHIFFL